MRKYMEFRDLLQKYQPNSRADGDDSTAHNEVSNIVVDNSGVCRETKVSDTKWVGLKNDNFGVGRMLWKKP